MAIGVGPSAYRLWKIAGRSVGGDATTNAKEKTMKMHLTVAAAGLLLLAGAGAAAAQDVIIQPEQQTVIREYVHKQPLASVEVPGVELSIGSTLPDTVELHEVPNVKYRYVVVDNQTIVVDPDTRKIVEVIQ